MTTHPIPFDPDDMVVEMTRAEVEDEIRECRPPRGRGMHWPHQRRWYLLGVLGWMDRNERDSFTASDADTNARRA